MIFTVEITPDAAIRDPDELDAEDVRDALRAGGFNDDEIGAIGRPVRPTVLRFAVSGDTPTPTRGASMTACVHCGAVVDPSLGADPPDGEWREGTNEDPRAPGDWDDICDVCNYTKGLTSGPARGD